jgi:hypothetical protein
MDVVVSLAQKRPLLLSEREKLGGPTASPKPRRNKRWKPEEYGGFKDNKKRLLRRVCLLYGSRTNLHEKLTEKQTSIILYMTPIIDARNQAVHDFSAPTYTAGRFGKPQTSTPKSTCKFCCLFVGFASLERKAYGPARRVTRRVRFSSVVSLQKSPADSFA